METTKYSFELLYELITSIFSQFPAVLEAFASLPLVVQQIVLTVGVILAVNIIIAVGQGVVKLAKLWAERH
ncbi:MAG TPA: hypothetical protein DDY77_03790 [Clostridiales bacterium]|nr:hypothetical protein [Clostridiales bacterium]